MTTGSKYTGKLAKPLECSSLLGLLILPKDRRTEIIKKNAMEKAYRLLLLCDHHGVERCNWFGLALKLAEAHVPGLREAKGFAGRPKIWGPLELAHLKIAIDDLMEQHRNLSLSDAARRLTRLDPWKSLTKKSGAKAAEVLRRMYYEADPRWVKTCRKAMAYDDVKKSAEQINSQEKMGE